MKDLGYGKDYKYPHNYKDAKAEQDYLPEVLKGKKYYTPPEKKKTNSSSKNTLNCPAHYVNPF